MGMSDMGMEHQGSENQQDDLSRVRHSLAHVLAPAVLKLNPGTTLGFGPPIRHGFYYDFTPAKLQLCPLPKRLSGRSPRCHIQADSDPHSSQVSRRWR